MVGRGAAKACGVGLGDVWQFRLRIRGQHDDLLGERAAGHHVGPGDLAQGFGEVAGGQRLLRHRRQRVRAIQLTGEFRLFVQQRRRRHQREQLRRLVPAACGDEFLDLTCQAGHRADGRALFVQCHGHMVAAPVG